MIEHLDLQYNKVKLLSEFEDKDKDVFRPSKARAKTWFTEQQDWKVNTEWEPEGEAGRLQQLFMKIFDKQVIVKYFDLKENAEIPPHKDLGHRTCINIILDGDAPVCFRDGPEERYECAMLNVAKRHWVPAGSRRKMVKFIIFDLFFDEALERWNNFNDESILRDG